jgi:hypothetical protein
VNDAQQIQGAEEVQLAVPIKAHGEEVQSLALRRPTTAEVRRIGRMPYIALDESGKVTPDMGVVPAYIAVCAGIPPSSVDQIDLSDLNQLAWTIAGFFLAPASPASRN